MSIAAATAYNFGAARHSAFSRPERRKAQKQCGFRANRTYQACIKDNVLLDETCGSVGFLMNAYNKIERGELYGTP